MNEKNIYQRNCSHQSCVSLVPIFNHLEDNQLKEVMRVVRAATVTKGEILYHAGEKAKSLYIVHQGLVKIYRLAESGKEQVIRLLHPGDFTGELALFQEKVHDSYAEAMTETNICTIHQDDLQHLLLKYPTISLKILSEFAQRLDHSERQTTRFATETVEARIATFLIECSDKNHSDRPKVFLPMRRKDIASFLGTTPETISRTLRRFEDEGLIEQNGHGEIIIADIDKLLLI